MPIQVFVADEQSDRPVEPGRWGELAERVLGGLTGDAGDVELNILFVDAATIASMNVRFLGHKGPTDVLSFPIEDDVLGAAGLGPPGSMAAGGSGPGRWEDPDEGTTGTGASGPGRWDEDGGSAGAGGTTERGIAGGSAGLPTLLGDVVICPAVAAANAKEHTGSFSEELALLVVHGILHLFGMDHETDDDATQMEALEQVLLDEHFRRVRT